MSKKTGTGTFTKAAGAKGGKGKNADNGSVPPVPKASKTGRGGRASAMDRESKEQISASGTQITNGVRKGRGGRNGALASHDSMAGAKQKSDASEPDVEDEDGKLQQKEAKELPKKNSIEKEREMFRTNLKLKSDEVQRVTDKSAKDLKDIGDKLQISEANCKQREEELDGLRAKLNKAETVCIQREKELSALRAESSNKIEELTAANDELRTRLSKHFGAKLQDNNPNIADLSDPNRPTKLAEQFSELYDNEWTNSFEVLKQHKNEVDVVAILLKACLKIYSYCIDKASTELGDLRRVFHDFNSESDVQLQKQLKDRRKKLKPDEQFQSKIASGIKELFGEKKAEHKKIIPYVQKCIEICWSMAIQDPPVYMDTEIVLLNMNGQPFDIAAYRAYTQSGPMVDFIVWPALYLHKGGAILQKGIAQGKV